MEAEIGRLLTGEFSGDDLVEELRAEQAAFDTDGGEGRHQVRGICSKFSVRAVSPASPMAAKVKLPSAPK